MSHYEWLVSSVIIFLSASLQSATGFGFALMAIPVLSLFFDPHWVIPLVMTTSFATLAMNMRQVWKSTDRDLLKKLLFGSLLGLPAGGFLFYWFDASVLRILVSIAILFFTVVLTFQSLISNLLHKVARHDWLFGTVSGMLTTSVGMPGPPIMLLLSAQNKQQGHFRSTGISYLFSIYPISLLILLFSGAPFQQIWKPVLVFIPFSFLGILAGNKLHAVLSPKLFRSMIYVMLLATGLYSIYKNL